MTSSDGRGIDARGFMKDAAAIEKYNQEFTANADSLRQDIDPFRR